MNDFFPENFYHIYNRGNNRERIFFKDENYRFFLQKFDDYLRNFLDIYAFCLMPNHFHFLVKLKTDLPGFENLEGVKNHRNPVSQGFSNLFNSYSEAINKQEQRTGSLFQKNFKKKLIKDESSLLRIICYIHRNPVHHNYTDDFENYKWSSYKILVSDKVTKFKRNVILDMFRGRDGFIDIHRSQIENFKKFTELEN